MPRARNIKPTFFTDDELGEIAPLGRLLFQGLWCHADRAGRLEERPKRFKPEILPYDDCDIPALLAALERGRFIIRYECGGKRYIQIRQFAKHQNPHSKEAASTIPAPDSPGAVTMQEPEVPERAGLIVDSGFPQPDSGFPPPKPTPDRTPAPRVNEQSAAAPPRGVEAAVWEAWVRQKGKTQTAEADRLQRKHLGEWSAAGHDPNAIVERAVASHWKGLAPPKGAPPAGRESERERARRNLDEICGVNDGEGRTINGSAHRVDPGAVPTLPGDVRCEDGANVGLGPH